MPNTGDCVGSRTTRASKRNPMAMYNRFRGEGYRFKVTLLKIKYWDTDEHR